MKLRKMNKEGAIATTLTWIAAFLITFFAALIFLAGAGVLSFSKKAPEVSEKILGGKSISLTDNPQEAKGYDSGDLKLQEDLNAFLDSEVKENEQDIKVKDLILKFDSAIYNSEKVLGSEEIRQNQRFNDFYASVTRFFDFRYNECYVLCVEFDDTGKIYQPIIGKDCEPVNENIYERERQDYRCRISESEVAGMFNYASFDVISNERKVGIKLLRGNLNGI